MIIEEITTAARRPKHSCPWYIWYIGGLAVPAPRRLFPSDSMHPAFVEWTHRDSEEISDAWKRCVGKTLSLPAVTIPFGEGAVKMDSRANIRKVVAVRNDGASIEFDAYLLWDVGDGSCNIKLVAMLPMDVALSLDLAFGIGEAMA